MLPNLPVFSIVFRAYGAVFRHLGAILRASLLPTLILLVIGAIEAALPGDGTVQRVVFWLIGAPFSAVMIAAYHRIVLLGPDALNNPWCLYWTPRETGFLGWMLLLQVMAAVLGFALSVVALMAPETVFGFRVPWLEALFVGGITAYVISRFSMVLPATALGKRVILSNSWYLTAGNGVRLVVALALPLAICLAASYAIFKLIAMLTPFLAIVLIWPFLLFSFAVEIAALSLSYRFLNDAVTEDA